MRATTIAGWFAVAGLAFGGAAVAQSSGAPAGVTSTQGGYGASAASAGRDSSAAAAAESRPRAGTGETASSSTQAQEPRDRRIEPLKGGASTASPNVDAAAAVNQIQIPDYPPPDSDRAQGASSKTR